MSRLIMEDDEFLYLERYIHDETGEFSKWEWSEAEKRPIYPQHIQEAEHYAFTEIKATYRIRKSDGEIFYDKFE